MSSTSAGTFRAVEPDLPRIRALGTDILWLMPIHPIGQENRKGSMGCPYANRDYRTVNPEYGTLEDFLHLVDAIHDNGMKCIIDVVYNHTSPDSTLVHRHPEYFYRRPDGKRGNKVGDWTDVVDLDYDVPGLWDYQIESLCYWAQYVDGFRCDVASTVPVAFWKKARRWSGYVPGLSGWARAFIWTTFWPSAARGSMPPRITSCTMPSTCCTPTISGPCMREPPAVPCP